MTVGESWTGLGFLTGILIFCWMFKHRRFSGKSLVSVSSCVGLVCGVIGARLFELVAEGWPIRVPWFAFFDPRSGGRALIGGLILGWIGVEVFKRWKGVKGSTGDLFALALAGGEGIGRIGCYYNGCCYGVPTSMPWAIYQHGAWRHPTQFYSAFSATTIFLFLLRLEIRRPRWALNGDLFLLYLVSFGITRFVIEFFRWRETLIFGLSPMQWVCLDLMGGGALCFSWKLIRRISQVNMQVGQRSVIK